MKRALLLIMALAMINVVSAFTIDGTVNYVATGTGVVYQHGGGTSTGIEQLTITDTSLIVNTYGYGNITMTSDTSLIWRYDTAGKKFYVTTAPGELNFTGLENIASSSTGKYEIGKSDGSSFVLQQDGLSSSTYTIDEAGYFRISVDTTLDSFGDYTNSTDSSAYETERVSWNLTMAQTIGDQFYEVILRDEYNNEYETTYVDSSGNRIYTADFNIPTEPTALTNVSFYWLARKYAGGSVQSDRFNVTVDIVDFYYNSTGYVSCPSGYSEIAMYAIDEDHPENQFTGTYLPLNTFLANTGTQEISYWFGSDGGQTYITENYGVEANFNDDTYVFCVYPSPVSTDLRVYYESYLKFDVPAENSINPLETPVITSETTCDAGGLNCNTTQSSTYYYDNNTFTQRWYSLPNYGFDTIYLINESEYYIPLQITLYDKYSGAKLNENYVRLQRYYNDEGAWRTVQTGKTDASGNALFYIREQTTDYRFVFYDGDGNIYETSSSMVFICNTALCTRSFYVDTISSLTSSRPSVYVESLYHNNTGFLDVRWFTDGEELTVNIEVVKSGTETTVICEDESFGASHIEYCDLSSYNGNIGIYVTSIYGGESKNEYSDSFVLNEDKIGSKLDLKDAVFFAFIIILVLIMTFVRSPVGLIFTALVGLIFMTIMGFFTGITITAIIGVVVIGIILILKVRKQ